MAKKFKFRLESVLKYRQILEDEKKREFAAANQAAEAQRQKALELQHERTDVLNSISEMRSKGGEIHLSSMVDSMRLVSRIEVGIQSARNETKRLENEMKGKRKAFVEAQRDKKAIEILKDKRKIAYNKELDRDRQNILDELSMRMAKKRSDEEKRDEKFRKLKEIENNGEEE